jgi:energy-coupling factor transporter ATP-binding protein EcfA2
MTTLKRILEWSKDLADWQRDAVRRLLTQETLTDKDDSDVLAMLKEAEGLVDPTRPAPTPTPLSEQHLVASHGGPRLVLKRLKKVTKVNALVAEQELLFSHEGITVVYGENGTGKSGYARVLKRACRARDQVEKIHPNVFDEGSSGPASAVFDIQVDGLDKEVAWVDGDDKPDELANIAVFDSKCARIILVKDNEPTYLPYGASVFEDLADLMKRVRAALKAEMSEPERPSFSEIDDATEVGKAIASLSLATKEGDVETIAVWTEQNEITLATLSRQITAAASENAQAAVSALRRLRGRLDKLSSDVTTIDTSLSAAAQKSITLIIQRAKMANDAAKQLVSDLSGGPLPEVGGETWKRLYEAAKKYSLEAAYPNQVFPVTSGEGVCVLCMQPISAEAAGRLVRFRDFMEGEVQRQVAAENDALRAEAKKLAEVVFAPIAKGDGLLEEIRERDEALARNVETYLQNAQARAASFEHALGRREPVDCSMLAVSPCDKLDALAAQLETEATRIERAMKPEELAKLKREQAQLAARKVFTGHKEQILKYLRDLRTEARYKRCIDATHTKHISDGGKAIIAESRTPELLRALGDELTELGAQHLPLNLKPSAAEGETRHKLILRNARLPSRTDLCDILSEGEQRVVAIAGFLAELAVAGHEGPIIFDDPVSSLDHRFRDRIAQRLAKEGARRQVIAFTHDIAFLLELKAKAAEMDGVPLGAQTVLFLGRKPGRCMDGEPWHAKNSKERLTHLQESLNNFRNSYEVDQPEYNSKAAQWYGLLRETWERVVEEDLLHEVIKCFGAEVQTMRLKEVEVTTDDYRRIDAGMSKCSKWMTGHRKAAAIDINQPAPLELDADISELRSFKKDVRTRGKDLRKQRERALEPPQANMG